MKALLKEIRHNPLLWLLAFVPVVFAAAQLKPEAHTLLFVLSVLAIVPLAGLLSRNDSVSEAGASLQRLAQTSGARRSRRFNLRTEGCVHSEFNATHYSCGEAA